MLDLQLRRATAADSEFAYHVKKAAFAAYVDLVWGWDESEQRSLHERRFSAQEYLIIEWMGIDAGVLALIREHGAIKLNQLMILPEFQGKGIGKECMRQILEEAAVSKKSVTLQVLKINHLALAFFVGVGFKKVGESDTHVLMQNSA